jgi:hypothetical protein
MEGACNDSSAAEAISSLNIFSLTKRMSEHGALSKPHSWLNDRTNAILNSFPFHLGTKPMIAEIVGLCMGD